MDKKTITTGFDEAYYVCSEPIMEYLSVLMGTLAASNVVDYDIMIQPKLVGSYEMLDTDTLCHTAFTINPVFHVAVRANPFVPNNKKSAYVEVINNSELTCMIAFKSSSDYARWVVAQIYQDIGTGHKPA